MKKEKQAFTVRLPKQDFLKIKTIAEIDKRTLQMQIEFVVSQFIKKYENENGTISLINNSINIDNSGNGNYVNINK